MNHLRSRVVLALLTTMLAFTALSGTAHAGEWMQVSCQNPNGSGSNSQGWVASTSSPGPDGSISANCGAGSPMTESLSTGAATTAFSDETLTYTPPTGSTLAGGTLEISGQSTGYGDYAYVGAVVYSPYGLFPGNAAFQCIYSFNTEPCAPSYSYSNTAVALPSNAGGTVSIQLACTGESGQSCDEGADSTGLLGDMEMSSADLLLSNQSVPTGSDVSGTALTPNASGAADVVFDASDPNGPGVYQVTADIDGTQVYQATPNTENGSCVPVGNDATTGALEFDYAQPCPQSVNVTVPIATTSLTNGKHHLTVVVTDAAGNTATVEDTYITVSNTLSTPLPAITKGVAKVRVKFIATPEFIGAATRLLKITHSALPKGARIALTVTGAHHPKLKLATATGARVATLLKDLSAVSFPSGDSLTFTITAPHQRAERVRVTFANQKNPAIRLL